MYNGGIFGGGPSGPLGFGVPSGWGNVQDRNETIGSIAQQALKENDHPKTMKMRNRFLSWFPKSNRSKFRFSDNEVSWGGKIVFPEGDRTNPTLIKDLGLDEGFPPQLLENKRGRYSIPQSKDSFSTNIRIYSSQENSFIVNFRNVFDKQQLKFTSAAECNKWKKGPIWKYWPQQLNFATWCATGGCGVSTNFDGLPKIVEGLLRFHIYFTLRRILYEMGCALPGDSGFNNINNPHNKAVIEALKKEFGTGDDFRFKRGRNGGLGDIYAHWTAIEKYPNKTLELRYTDLPKGWPQDKFKFRDEYEPNDMYLIAYLKNDDSADQAFWYLLQQSYGLTTPGMGRLNRSIEAFVYCVLGAQVNMRSSIVGGGGIAQEVRQELTQLFEKAVIEEDLSDSVQRYQEAIENSRVKLDFAVTPGVWLLPSNLEINLTSKVGYNNFLLKATSKMKLGVNNVNRLPAGDATPSPTTPTKEEQKKIADPKPATSAAPSGIAEAHQDTLVAIAIVVAGAAWWAFR